VTRAVQAQVRGLVEGRPELLEEAVRLLGDGPRLLALAEAHEDLGHALATGGTVPAAIAHLREALTLLQRCGAARDHDRVRQSMSRLGVRPSANPRRSTATTGWDSLSESELRVVPLVAEGLTNRAIAERLFLSVHTVNTHLRHVFAKLGINSRVELTRFLMERGTTDVPPP
jgi:DNA-binding CsgD family transcriptional regulator